MDQGTTVRASRAEPQCDQGLNEPVEPVLVFCFLDPWLQTGCGNRPGSAEPTTRQILAERLGGVQSGLQAHDLIMARHLAPGASTCRAAAQFNPTIQRGDAA